MPPQAQVAHFTFVTWSEAKRRGECNSKPASSAADYWSHLASALWRSGEISGTEEHPKAGFLKAMNRQTLMPTILVVIAALGAAAQTAARPAAQGETGFTAYAEFGGTSNADGQIYELNTSAGYNFSQHLGMDVGVPIYFVRPSSTTGAISNNGFGNPFVDARLKFLNPAVNFGSTLTGSAPLADSKKGFSTGRGTFDWTNRFDRGFSNLTPFAEVGIANTIADSRMFLRPFTTLGFNTHFRAGANYDLWKFFSAGASAFDIVPAGQQTIFSKVVGGSAPAGPPSQGRVFQDNQQTTGSADIARDHGFSTWLDASPSKSIDMELGFTRSMHYDLNSVSFTLGFDLGQLYRKAAN
jgi:hypothetical protein